MSNLSRTCLCAAFTALLASSAFGCDDGPADRIENRLDCRQICDKYHECINDNTDLEACRDNCVDEALETDEQEAQVDACSDCVSDEDSCVENAFKCADECVGIVP